MFTGLIEDVGEIAAVARHGQGCRLTIRTGLPMAEIALGDSVAVNGTCLTAVALGGDSFTCDVSQETLDRTNLGTSPVGAAVNLERALRVGDRLGGHWVQGHVDAVGRFMGKATVGAAWEMRFELPQGLLSTIVEKGSITLNGISLTVATLRGPAITVAVVPHTAAQTTLGALQPGALVNVETDIIGKYVQRAVSQAGGGGGGVSLDTLKAFGFA